MALASWWRGAALPRLVPVPGFYAEASRDEPVIAHVTGLDPAQVRQRLAGGHQPYLAYIAAAPVGYGWVAQAVTEHSHPAAAIGRAGVDHLRPGEHTIRRRHGQSWTAGGRPTLLSPRGGRGISPPWARRNVRRPARPCLG